MKPHEMVAAHFMANKGYPDAVPDDVEQVDGKTCWYFWYTLEDGDLEIEVLWEDDEWSVRTTGFRPFDDNREPEEPDTSAE